MCKECIPLCTYVCAHSPPAFQGLLIGVHVMNFCVCCLQVSEFPRIMETYISRATVLLAISVPEITVLWNLCGVHPVSVVHHIWRYGTARPVFSNDVCSAISKILHPFIIFLCIIYIFCIMLTFSVNCLGICRIRPRKLNHRWLLNNSRVQKWSRHWVWLQSLAQCVVHVTCAIMQCMLKKRQGGHVLDLCGSGYGRMRSCCVCRK